MEAKQIEKNLVEIDWMKEVLDQEFDDDIFGACTTNTFSLSDYWGNNGGWCTATHECMSWCK
ncbi:plantaricin C family lantibiotic [Listeria sp. FSL L7-1582]|nr:plantaricin C family lantibiotic [Listeria portnoyi]